MLESVLLSCYNKRNDSFGQGNEDLQQELGAGIDRVSLHVEPNEFVIIVGQSGAGKSTLLKLLTREERPTSGKIIVGGIDYDKLRDRDIPLIET